MDKSGLLHNIAEKHGNEWPVAALQRMLVLAAQPEKTPEEEFEYSLLVDWVQEMIETGVAFSGAAW